MNKKLLVPEIVEKQMLKQEVQEFRNPQMKHKTKTLSHLLCQNLCPFQI